MNVAIDFPRVIIQKMRYILTRIATVISTYLYRDEELDLFFRPLPVYTLMACVENVMKNDKYGSDLTCHMRGIPPPPPQSEHRDPFCCRHAVDGRGR